MAKQRKRFIKITIFAGLILMGFSVLIFLFANNGFFGEIHSELFGAGIALFVIGGLAALFKVRI